MKAKRAKKAKQVVKTAEIVPVVRPQPLQQMVRLHQLNNAELTLLKNTIAKGCSDDEFAMFLWVAHKHKLDPMTRQLHPVKRNVSKHHQDEKGIWVSGEVMTIQIGIDGYRTLAARNHKDFGGVDEPEYEFEKKGDKIPTLARVRVWKKGFERPSVGIAFWDEYAPADLDNAKSFMWKKMPKHMLAKCAEALALRKGYPDLADIYTDEEMDQYQQDFTDDGRRIVLENGRTPSGLLVEGTSEQQKVLDAHLEDFQRKEKEQLAKLKDEGRLQPPKAIIPDTPLNVGSKKEKPLGTIEWHWLGEKDMAYLGGDGLGQLLDTIKSECFVQWLPQSKRNVIVVDDFQKLKDLCAAKNYRFVEIQDKPEQVPAESPAMTPSAGSRSQETERKAGPQQSPAPSAGPTIVSGHVDKVDVGMTTRNSPVRQVKLGKIFYACYSQTLHPFIDKAVGKDCSFYIDGRKNIVGIKNIGPREFDSDGRTPLIDVNEERKNTASLFQ